jgi:signal transduction histidine kinase
MSMVRGVLLLSALLLGSALSAQQQLGRSMQQLPAFADTTLHQQMERILLQMDAFHADSSLRLINEAMPLAGTNQEALCYLLSYRAEVLYYEGLFNAAMRDLDQCEQLAQAIGDSTLIANAFNLKGLLHENIQDSRQALPYLRKALLWFPRRPAARYPVTELHHIHGNMGSYLTNMGELDSAAVHVKRSLELAQEAGSPRAIAVAWWSLGNLALLQQRADSALRCFTHGFEEADAADDHDIGVDVLVGKSKAHAALHDRPAALRALAEARAYLDQNRDGIGLVTQRNFARVASSALRLLGDLDGALNDLGEWHRIDSLITARNIQSALNTQAELLRADNDLEVERLEKDRYAEALDHVRTTRWISIAGAALVLIALTALYLLNSSRQRHKQRLTELELARERQEHEIAALRVREQVGRDLHDDLGVGLSGLKLRSEMALLHANGQDRDMLLREQARTAEELLASMRHIIWALQDDQSELSDMVAYTTNYARNYLNEHGIGLTVEAEGPWPDAKLSTTERRNCFLLVKEALHNVVKHARARHVVLRIRWDGTLVMDVIDDGKGLNDLAGGSGNGLRNMRKRVEGIGGSMELVKARNGTHLRFVAPLAERKFA